MRPLWPLPLFPETPGKLNTANLARDLGLPSDTLDAFCRGQTKLAPATLQALALHLFHGHATYDADRDLLRPTPKPEPSTLGAARPPPVTQMMQLPRYQGGPPPPAPGMVPPSPPRKPRPGWAAE